MKRTPIRHHLKKHVHHFKLLLLIIPLLLMAGYVGYRIWKPKQIAGPLNVILISIDSLRPDHMGLYGYDRNTTPNIDTWAKDAAVFKNYYSTSFLTPISEVSVHTGKYPFTTGVVNFESELPTSTLTLAEILKKNGWQTAAFGSSAEFTGYLAGFSLSRGFDIYNISKAGTDPFNGRGNNATIPALSWVKNVAQSGKPFFLWLPLGSVHWPYGQTEQHHFSSSTYDGYFRDISHDTWNHVDYIYNNQFWGRTVRNEKLRSLFTLPKEDFEYIIGRYDDGIVMTDRRIGLLLDYLKSSGLDEHTVVILESEHGEGFNERGYIMHYDIYDEQVHTPLIIKAPKLKPQQITALTSGVDVLPTLLSILDLPKTETEGVNLLPYLLGKETNTREVVYLTRTSLWERVMASMQYEDMQGFLTADNKEHFADTGIRNTEWKLIHRRARGAMERWGWFNHFKEKPLNFPEYELYNITTDPGETKNIYEEEKTNPSVIYLEERLREWERKQFNLPLPPTTAEELQPYF